MASESSDPDSGEEMRAMPMIRAPWTADQVESLNAYQACDFVHSFTYDDEKLGKVDLIARPEGWVSPSDIDAVVQDWAHAFMLDWSEPEPFFRACCMTEKFITHMAKSRAKFNRKMLDRAWREAKKITRGRSLGSQDK